MNPGDAVVALIAEIRSAVGADEAVSTLLQGFAERVRAEPGNLVFAAWRTADDPTRFLVYEEYSDGDAFHAHLTSSHNRAFNDSITPYVLGGGSALTRLAAL